MNLPPFVYSLAFWQALCYVVAAIVAYFTPYKVEAGVLLILILAILKLFLIVPELRARRIKQLQGIAGTQERQGSTTIQYFKYEHLPKELQAISKPVAELAYLMESSLPNSAEKSAGMRKLLEAKDCFVRTLVK